VTRQLYNALLEERREAWKRRGIAITTKQQYRELTELRRSDKRVAAIYRECEDAALHRLDLAMQAFFRRIKRGETPGYPRYRSARRWRQLEFPHGDRALKFDAGQQRVRVPGIGSVKLRKGRAVANFGRAWLVRKNDHWYAQFECEVEAQPLPASGESVGIDRGVRTLLATSDGDTIANPGHLERSRCKLERWQRIVAKRKRGGKNRKRAVVALARQHARVANARRDYAHKVARTIVNRYDTIALEDLRVRNMTRSARGSVEAPGRNVSAKAALNRALLDAAFGLIARLIEEKAASALRKVVRVDARFTSQTCSGCERVDASARRGRCYSCDGCGIEMDADVNAAINIKKRAESPPAPRRAGMPDVSDARSELSPVSSRLTRHDAA
jgi:putative transposase